MVRETPTAAWRMARSLRPEWRDRDIADRPRHRQRDLCGYRQAAAQDAGRQQRTEAAGLTRTNHTVRHDPVRIFTNSDRRIIKEDSMIRKAKAVWHGTGRAGSGHVTTDSGVLDGTPYTFKTRFEHEKGTNPEELIAAAHAGCFTMALAFSLQGAGFTPAELSTEAPVTLEPDSKGFRISQSVLTLRAKAPNLDDAGFARLAGEAEKNCPVYKVFNATITLDAKLI
jgi:osmotically inducible protein OsmC